MNRRAGERRNSTLNIPLDGLAGILEAFGCNATHYIYVAFKVAENADDNWRSIYSLNLYLV